MKDSTILLTGATGFLGSRISYYYKKYKGANRGNFLTPTREELNLYRTDNIIEYVKKTRPSIIVHTAAFADTSYCESHPGDSYEINVRATRDLAGAAADIDAEFIFMSSDAVYNGNSWVGKELPEEQCNREEQDDHPVNVYGKHKKEAEKLCFETGGRIKALRLTWMYDCSRYGMKNNKNMITNLLEAKEKGKEISFALHEFRGITNVWEVVKNLEKTIELPVGIYNFGSHNLYPTIEVAKKAGRLIGIKDELILTDEQRWLPTGRNLAISQAKLNQHGITFYDTIQGLEYWKKEEMI